MHLDYDGLLETVLASPKRQKRRNHIDTNLRVDAAKMKLVIATRASDDEVVVFVKRPYRIPA